MQIMKVFRKKSGASHLSRAEALEYTPAKSRQISEIRLETGEVVIEYPLMARPWIGAVARRLGGPQMPKANQKAAAGCNGNICMGLGGWQTFSTHDYSDFCENPSAGKQGGRSFRDQFHPAARATRSPRPGLRGFQSL